MSDEHPYTVQPFQAGINSYYNGDKNRWPVGSEGHQEFQRGWQKASENEARRRAER